MSIELKVPEIGESITEVEIGDWLKQAGEVVKKDDPIVTLESEKATVEFPAPDAGTITKILKQQGETAKVGEVIAYLERDGRTEEPQKEPETKAQEAPEPAAERKSPKAQRDKPKACETAESSAPRQVRNRRCERKCPREPKGKAQPRQREASAIGR